MKWNPVGDPRPRPHDEPDAPIPDAWNVTPPTDCEVPMDTKTHAYFSDRRALGRFRPLDLLFIATPGRAMILPSKAIRADLRDALASAVIADVRRPLWDLGKHGQVYAPAVFN